MSKKYRRQNEKKLVLVCKFCHGSLKSCLQNVREIHFLCSAMRFYVRRIVQCTLYQANIQNEERDKEKEKKDLV